VLLSSDGKIVALYDSEGIRFLETQTGKQSLEIKWNIKSESEIPQNEFDGFYDREVVAFAKDKFAVAFRKKKREIKNENRPTSTQNIFTLKLWNIARPETPDSQSIEIEADLVE